MPFVVIVVGLQGVGFRSLKWLPCGVHSFLDKASAVSYFRGDKSFYHTVRD